MDGQDFVRVPPHSIEAEQAVLGGLMLDANAVDAVAERLVESDFYQRSHRGIFRAVMHLSAHGRPFDAVTLSDWFDEVGITEQTGGAAYVIHLANTTPSAANIVAYADIVRDKSLLRQMIDAATELATSAFGRGGASGQEILDATIARLMAMQRMEARHEFTLRQALGEAYKGAQAAKALDGAIPGIPSGLKRLDEILGGWHNSDLIAIGARPSMGKTALLLNFAMACGRPCGIISAEQPARQIGGRVLSMESKVDAMRLRNGDFDGYDLQKLEQAATRLVERTCQIYDRSAPTIADVTRIARKWRQQNGIEILFVDYIQRIEGSERKDKKHERVGEVVRGLKNIARDLDIPVVALGQVVREVDKRPDKRPGMGDMSDSSDIEKEADQILMLYRDEVYNDNSDSAGIAEINVEKNRHGPTGFVKCAWLAPTMRFRDLDYGH